MYNLDIIHIIILFSQTFPELIAWKQCVAILVQAHAARSRRKEKHACRVASRMRLGCPIGPRPGVPPKPKLWIWVWVRVRVRVRVRHYDRHVVTLSLRRALCFFVTKTGTLPPCHYDGHFSESLGAIAWRSCSTLPLRRSCRPQRRGQRCALCSSVITTAIYDGHSRVIKSANEC